MTSRRARLEHLIALLAVGAIAAHLVLRYAAGVRGPAAQLPLWIALGLGGAVLVADLAVKLVRREFGSDLLAGMSIVTSAVLGEYLAGTLVVLMLSGGRVLESYATRSASSVLEALARRMPSVAHVYGVGGKTAGVALDRVKVGDVLVVFPHEICPVDGTVVEGHGAMNEAYLTGEPYVMAKAPGSPVLSGAVNGETALTVRATRLAVDSRYARIMDVMRESAQHRPKMRRLGDRLGAVYTPVAVGLALAAWLLSGESVRFLAVLVVATPCPLLIAIPVAVIGSVSLAAKRAIVVKDPASLEAIDTCRTILFDKTGTLTYGEPVLTEVLPAEGVDRASVLSAAASMERYSKHPLAGAVVAAAEEEGLPLQQATAVREPPGRGLRGVLDGRDVAITSRKALAQLDPGSLPSVPPVAAGLECVVLLDGRYAATLRFRDEPRRGGAEFIRHLGPKHRFDRMVLVSGDRESEVRYLAEKVGVQEVHAGMSPEDKVRIVREEVARAPTVFVGDGINDAPALAVATVGIAFGPQSDITSEAAGLVVMDSTLSRIDEVLHIGRRMRRIALQSAVGGMALSLGGMLLAAAGHLPPVAGAVAQEIIDVLAVANALRVAARPRSLSDF